MKAHIEKLLDLAEAARTQINPHGTAETLAGVAEAIAAALADVPAPCTDCGSKQGAAIKPPRSRKPVKATTTPAA